MSGLDTLISIASVILGVGSAIWKTSKAEEEIKNLIGRNYIALSQEMTTIQHEIEKLKITNNNDHEKFVVRDSSISEALNQKVERLEKALGSLKRQIKAQDVIIARGYQIPTSRRQ